VGGIIVGRSLKRSLSAPVTSNTTRPDWIMLGIRKERTSIAANRREPVRIYFLLSEFFARISSPA
jgi:hypothetical protein